jgi:hypothetical protein
MSRRNMILAALLSLFGCAPVAVPPPEGRVAAIGQVAYVDGVQVRPIGLLEDSRCPALVRCIWAGRLRIEALIQFHGGSEQMRREMTLGEAIKLPEGNLTLIEAIPAPVAGRVTVPSAYRFTFALTP